MCRFCLWSLVVLGSITVSSSAQLRVSDNHRYLVGADGSPFFYLGDTAWELFHRTDRKEADLYLEEVLHAFKAMRTDFTDEDAKPIGRFLNVLIAGAQ